MNERVNKEKNLDERKMVGKLKKHKTKKKCDGERRWGSTFSWAQKQSSSLTAGTTKAENRRSLSHSELQEKKAVVLF